MEKVVCVWLSKRLKSLKLFEMFILLHALLVKKNILENIDLILALWLFPDGDGKDCTFFSDFTPHWEVYLSNFFFCTKKQLKFRLKLFYNGM